ncbi:CHC2 zinc finger domain-containing protein [Clostridium sp. HBUAS56010]|uniref:CHC2 zinc finger domain-containing protein n=1 Tax=Clostridium sp. HBUAS56010 TaxID=2571127 RepID=UPI001177C961|nr:CHC2 zinc finger domain-containing protein [Clostridium sp. HBUAS56010]
MALYDEDMLEEINSNVDLLDYIGNTMELKQRGKDYFGHCTLHIDRTSSFSITPAKNKFFCFSCGAGGGIIQYLILYEKLSFDEAVQKASRLADVDLKAMCQSETVKLNKVIRKIHNNKTNYVSTHEILDSGELLKYKDVEIPEWVEEGISSNVLKMFGVRLDSRGNRIVYPVYDMVGNLINIKGRTLCKEFKFFGIQKYINYYPVGTLDYFQGMNITLQYIKESGEVKIFESIKSVMKLFTWGTKDSASAEKHTLTPEQVKILISTPEIKSVVFCYDSDVSYKERKVKENIDLLKRFVNVYVIVDRDNLLGGAEGKNSPVDLGKDIWESLYRTKVKIK